MSQKLMFSLLFVVFHRVIGLMRISSRKIESTEQPTLNKLGPRHYQIFSLNIIVNQNLI